MAKETIVALVTGASSGIGAEYCRQLAERCGRVIAVARRGERLAELQGSLSTQTDVHTVEADLTTVEGVAKTLEALRQLGPVHYLVNNAGFSTFGFFSDQDIQSQRDMVSLHIDATITLCAAAVPYMRQRGDGYIINVASIGGFLPSKGVAVYGATKSFLNFYSQALQAELAGSGIEIQALCPGYTHTEFQAGMDELGFDKSKIPEHMWMSAEKVVTKSLDALGSGQVLVITGDENAGLVKASLQRQIDELAVV
ncbi:MAG: SDR family NAD(P)-dependent oxidoreductase [Pseudomonadota bacterium]